MNYLIDIPILIWQIEDNAQLSRKISNLIEDEKNLVYISLASLWKITIKSSLGKLNMSKSMLDIELFLRKNGYFILNYNFNHLEVLLHLPFHHQDPFDRMIIAQGVSENLTILTNDDKFRNYQASIIFN
jgi:PIN domain nuclease of toxin-antitoxin system